MPVAEVAKVMGLTEEQIRRAFRDLERKRRTTAHLRTMPLALSRD
ncbi:MAG: hypothetical protein PVF54_03050 [Anaerolineae bacterium]